ncbi:hypothetical protein BDR05DRAFT_1004483 [Suillus weaverae]|nr:hypothetical protein BDR05DRAFT_1004483 [Suillus weaverae]
MSAFAFPLLAFEALPSAPLRDPPQGGPQRGAQVPPSKGRMRSFGVRPYREAKTWEASQSTAVLKAGFIDEVRRIDLIRPSKNILDLTPDQDTANIKAIKDNGDILFDPALPPLSILKDGF